MLSSEQERFLTEFYALCHQYKQAGVVTCSHGFVYNGYEVSLLIQPKTEIQTKMKKVGTAQL
ncbi:MAG: hypothetical protein MUF72_18800 [Elainella sp. Prado103]|jgi:hypothetical protein|nr:hypothetical protein [Elainella sp. Prado103]